MLDFSLSPEQEAWRITRVYVVLGALWILFSDALFAVAIRNPAALTYANMLKGWFYVFVTGIIFYRLLLRSLSQFWQAREEVVAGYEELDAKEQELEHLAYHDGLTGLKHRGALEAAAFKSGAWLLIDCDGFQEVNQLMGHSTGDVLLKTLAQRLSDFVADSGEVYRLGGDEFVVLYRKGALPRSVEAYARRVLEVCCEPVSVDGGTIHLTVSIGAALFPAHGRDFDTLLNCAVLAMQPAKERGGNSLQLFDDALKEQFEETMRIKEQLRTALERNELEVYYQPQLDAQNGNVTGFEALLRWNNPVLGQVPAPKTIEAAESTLLIGAIGQWVLDTACRFLKELHEQGHVELNMAVNVSMIQLMSEDFVHQVLTILDDVGLSPSFLVLELTESVVAERYESVAWKLEALRGHVIGIALDDFGTGYSSLAALEQLPISTIKVDRSSVARMADDPKSSLLGRQIIEIGRAMGLQVVAEGVETEEQCQLLRVFQCHKMQGYLFSRPEPAAKVRQFLGEHH